MSPEKLASLPRPAQRSRIAGDRSSTARKAKARARLVMEPLEPRMLLASFVVNSNSDAANAATTPGTLRYAITQLNTQAPGSINSITFSLPTAFNNIAVTSSLPTVVRQVAIDGTSNLNAGNNRPTISGPSGSRYFGLVLGAGSDGSTINALAIGGFSGAAGIDLISKNDVVVNSYLGVQTDGKTAAGNGFGVAIEATATGATIGGSLSGTGNVISGNASYGLMIIAPSVLVAGNYVGTDSTGVNALGNGGYGVYVTGASATIGGVASKIVGSSSGLTLTGGGNLVSANGSDGLYLAGNSAIAAGNVVGLDITGSKALRNNGVGITAVGTGTIVGGTSASIVGTATGFTINGGNLSSGNLYAGIYLNGPSMQAVGNVVGLDASGTKAIANGGSGIYINGSTSATIGGTSGSIIGSATGATISGGNLVSGNIGDGLYLGTASLVAAGNVVGLNAAGSAAVPNTGIGIAVVGSKATIGGTSGSIVGSSLGATIGGGGNLVSGNGGAGVSISGLGGVVAGNVVGLNAAGSQALGNSADGIDAVGTSLGSTSIGSLLGSIVGSSLGATISGGGNLVSGNGGAGVSISGTLVVAGNVVGLDVTGSVKRGNAGNGITSSGSGATIGKVAGSIVGTSSGATISGGNLVSGNNLAGIYLSGASALAAGNVVGLNAAGTAAVQNGYDGIYAIGSNATIGGVSGSIVGSTTGATIGGGNLVSGNGGNGVYLGGASALAAGNVVGLDATGSKPLGNGSDGIYVVGSNATIGGTSGSIVGSSTGATIGGGGNLVSGNGVHGLFLNGASALAAGNVVGLNAAGTAAVQNGYDGIYANRAGATIGGVSGSIVGSSVGATISGGGNLVSGNGVHGLFLNGASALAAGNVVGLDATGSKPLGNGTSGIYANRAGATIGGVSGSIVGSSVGATISGGGNLVSGNGVYGDYGNGVYLSGASALAAGNVVGLDATGSKPLGNGSDGIYVVGSNATIGGTSGSIVGSSLGATIGGGGNLVSGNGGNGVYLGGASASASGNVFGLDVTGSKALGNLGSGIVVSGTNAMVGGSDAETYPGSYHQIYSGGNLISGNLGAGVSISGASAIVAGNAIGLGGDLIQPAGNGGDGIVVAATGAIIGGPDYPVNYLAYNGKAGLATAAGVTSVAARYNVIYGNLKTGIDLGDNGVTPNTPGRGNNSPVLTGVTSDGDVATITGTLNAAPNSEYTLDFYANPTADSSAARPQGRDSLDSRTVLTNASGNVAFSFEVDVIFGEPFYTAVSIDSAGMTSEFSNPANSTLTPNGVTLNATVGVPFQGTVATFSSGDPTATAADFTANINYGDGTAPMTGTVVAGPGGYVVTGAHTFISATPATPVSVTITDNRNFIMATARSVAVVSAATTTPPGVVTAYGRTVPFVAGTPYSRVVAGFTDTDSKAFPTQFTAVITWGDGSAPTVGTITIDGAGFDVTGTHTYNQAGTYPVTVAITDAATAKTVNVASTAVVDAVPITIQPKSFAVTGKKNFSGPVATFTDGDPRTDPTFYAATIDWGDGSPTTAGTITGTNPFTISGTHTFPVFQNTHLVTITLIDKNGRTATAVDRVVDPPDLAAPADPITTTTQPTIPTATSPTPAPAPLAIHAGGITVPRHGTYRGVLATFSDPAASRSAAEYTAVISWGKGRKAAGMVVGGNGVFSVLAGRAASALSLARSVKITINDGHGHSVSASELITRAAAHKVVPHVPARAAKSR